MTEMEKRPEQQPAERPPVKSSQKFARFLSYHLQDAGWVDELPLPVRVPFKAMLTWTMKHQDELFSAVADDQLDEFLAGYGDLLLQLRSDDAAPVRIVSLEGWDPDALAAFDYFHQHRAEITELVEKRASQNDGEPLEVAPPTQVPGQMNMLEETAAEEIPDEDVDFPDQDDEL